MVVLLLFIRYGVFDCNNHYSIELRAVSVTYTYKHLDAMHIKALGYLSCVMLC